MVYVFVIELYCVLLALTTSFLVLRGKNNKNKRINNPTILNLKHPTY